MLTVITDPIPTFKEKFISIIKPYLYHILKGKKYDFENRNGVYTLGKYYGGHYSVTRSLLEGLDKLGVEYIYNPKNRNRLSSEVILLAGVNTLKQAIHFKSKGYIRKLYAGPNIVVSPLNENEILLSPEIDKIIVPSQWVRDFYIKDAPTISEKIVIWPAGVDENYWNPIGIRSFNKIIFFKKIVDESFYNNCLNYCKEKNFSIKELIYSNYNIKDYKNELNSASLLVHFVDHESQCISNLEAWSMNVPTYVYNPGTWLINSNSYQTSSSPYLSQRTGEFFSCYDEFKKLMNNFSSNKFCSRKWVLENMTDEICSKQLLQLLDIK